MPARRTPHVVALALAGTVALSGCTGRPEPNRVAEPAAPRPPTAPPTSMVTPPPGEPASADQAFVAAAEHACGEAIRALATPTPAPASAAADPLEQHLARVEVALDGLRRDLSGLEPPASGTEDHAQLVGIVAEEAAAVRQARAAAAAGDGPGRDQHLEAADALEDEFGERARELALAECGRLATTAVA